MNNSVNNAKQKMLDGKYTCVVLIDNDEYTSYERGVKPLLSLLQTGRSFAGAVAADKCVGAGAAHLYVLFGRLRGMGKYYQHAGNSSLQK